MKEKTKLFSTLVDFSLLLCSVILLVPNKFKAYPIILLGLFSILHYCKSSIRQKFPFKKVGLLSIVFIVFGISVSYTDDVSSAFSKLSTMASLLIFPVIFSLLDTSGYTLKNAFLKRFFLCFIFSNILFAILTFCYFWNQEFTFSETIVHYSNLTNIRLGAYSIHPIYHSLYIGVALLMLVHLIKFDTSLFNKIGYALIFVFFGIVMAILMRKGPIIYLALSLLLLMLFYFKMKRALLAVGVLVVIIAFSIQYLPKYKGINRFEELMSMGNSNAKTSTNARLDIYLCAFEKIKEKPFLGYGAGAVQPYLDACYAEKQITFDDNTKTYNSHNQYLSIALTVGVLGLLLYLLSLYPIIRIYIRQKSFLGLSILVYFLLNFLSENIIEREHGVLLYAMLLCIFFYKKDELYNCS